MRFFITRDQVARQATQNLIDAGVLSVDEAQKYLSYTIKLNPEDLLSILLESHQIKEDVGNSNINSYPIDYLAINEN